MARPREFDPEAALDRCLDLFRAKGFLPKSTQRENRFKSRGVTVGAFDVCERTPAMGEMMSWWMAPFWKSPQAAINMSCGR